MKDDIAAAEKDTNVKAKESQARIQEAKTKVQEAEKEVAAATKACDAAAEDARANNVKVLELRKDLWISCTISSTC